MRLRLWWWRKVRKAIMPKSDRDIFERFGEAVIGSFLAGGLQPQAPELQAIYGNAQKLKHATDWLTERGDSHEQREQRLETVEWAILLFVFVSFVLDAMLVYYACGARR